jgi:competence ComEA-like helix-hairpin-helix protein
MSPAAPPLGVAAPSPLPPPPAVPPAVPTPPAAPAVALPATPDAFRLAWPSAAQAAVALLALLTLGLLGWHAYARSRWATRPLALTPGDAEVFRIDLNKADAVTLMQLPGCGEVLAERIVAYRERYGPFRSLSDLRNVHGVGPSLLERWRDRVYLSRPEGDEDGEPEVKGGRPATQNPPPPGGPPRPAAGKKPLAPGERINVNRAPVEELQRLDGIGPTLAARIVEARRDKPFRSADDLKRVHGIGPKTLDKIRSHVAVD